MKLNPVSYPHTYTVSFDGEEVGQFQANWAAKAVQQAMSSLGRETVAKAQANDDVFVDCRLDANAQDGLHYRRNEYVGQ